MITIGATFDKMLKQRIFMLFNGNRDVTHTYNLTISTDKSQYDYGESIVVDGLLLRDNAPLPNVAIYIYKGDTLMGTVITDDNGAFSKSINNPTAGEYEIKAFYGSTESNKVNITTRRVVTSLDIDVPLSLVYSDAFNITGTLLDVNSSPLSNKSVKLKVGSTVVDTKTTNSNGVVSFTQTPVTMGTHTFQLIYDGDDTYSNISSPSVTRSINKETTVLTVTSPTNNTTIYTDGSISVSGSLVTNDNEKINGRTVYVKEGNTVITSYTTNSNGVFSGTITGLSASTHTLTFVFEGDSNYTGSSVSRNVIVNNHTYTLSLTADKNIISSSESSTITALLKRDGIAYSSQTVSYTIKHGSTTISSGSKTTNSNGQATISYTGTGVGDVSVIVSYGSLLQETYEVKDGLFRDTSTTPNNKWWITSSNGSITHDTTGITFNNTGTSYSRMNPYIVETFPSTWSEKENAAKFIDTPFIVEFDVKSISNTNAITLDTNSTLYSNNVSPNDHVKLVCDGSTGKVYINDVEVNSKSYTFTNSWFAFRINSTVELTIDNFVVYSI